MTNRAFPLGAQKILGASINFAGDTIKACLLPSTYTFDGTDEFKSDLGTTVGTDQTLANKVLTGGVLDADDLNFGAIVTGSTLKAVAVYKDTGNPSTSPVLFYFDVITGFPLATNGGIVTVPWDDGIKKIARIGSPFYPLGGQKVLSGAINFDTDNLKVALLPDSYTYNDSHEFLNNVGTRIGTDQALANTTITGGVFNADAVSFGAIAAGPTIGTVIIYKDTGSAATSPLLIAWTTGVLGLPLATNGGPVGINWNTGSAKIFAFVPA